MHGDCFYGNSDERAMVNWTVRVWIYEVNSNEHKSGKSFANSMENYHHLDT